MPNPIKAIINRLIWGGYGGYITYVNRGGPGGVEQIPISHIVEVGSGGIVVRVGASTRYIPFHRIVEVRDGEGRVLLRRGHEA